MSDSPRATDSKSRSLAAVVPVGLVVVTALALAYLAEIGPFTNNSDDTSAASAADTEVTAAVPTTTAVTSSTTTSTSSTTTSLPVSSTLPAGPAAALGRFVDEATPEELAYRLVVTGLDGTELGGRLADTVGSACVGGVFLTESNDNWSPESDPDAFRAAVDRLDSPDGHDDPDDPDDPDSSSQTWTSQCTYRPLLTTDAELGSVVRVPVESPAAAPTWGAAYSASSTDSPADPDQVLADLREQAAAYAGQLRDLGIDVNFGTVADVDTSPEYFMASQGRSFGDDPTMVAALAGAMVDGHCDAGVAPTLKHFPNQGATVEDPHAEPSTAIGGLDLWQSTGRAPYDDTRAPVVMTGHIFLADLDPDRPASLSRTITTGLLRDELGFDGVIITDDLSTMRGAIDIIADPGERAVAAVRAGADLVLFVDDGHIAPVVEALIAEMEADPTFQSQARTSVERSLSLALALAEQELPDPELAQAPAFPLCR